MRASVAQTCVDEGVRFERIALRKTGMADLALVGFLAGVYSEVPLEFEGVGRGVGAVYALIRSLASMAAHVTLQFAQFHA